jgi:hypothetical protein
MNDEIENLLHEMPLRKPSPALDDRVLAGLRGRPPGQTEAPARRPRRWWALPAAGAALAVAAAIVIALALPRGTETGGPGPDAAAPPEPGSVAQAPEVPAADAGPVRMEQDWSELTYEGVVVADEETPLRKYRHQTLEHVQWFDPRRGIRVESTVPREEVILVKATVY